MSWNKSVEVKDPILLLWALSGDTISLKEGLFEYTMGNYRTKEVYLTKIGEQGEETFTHVRNKKGSALIPRKEMVEILLMKEYTVS